MECQGGSEVDTCTPPPDNDTDADGTADCIDNCPNDFNPAQTDCDIDTIGDACDADTTDFDDDGVDDACDNCEFICNLNQSDADSDGIGDVCDGDPKCGGSTCGGSQPACETECFSDDDSDMDGIVDDEDNCPDTQNSLQEDADEDGFGDACDNCPADPNKTDPGICGCDVADDDTDGDLIEDCIDNCPNVENPGQEDIDQDGIGDACESCFPSEKTAQGSCTQTWNPDDCCSGMCGRYSNNISDMYCIDDPSDLGPGACELSDDMAVVHGFSNSVLVCCNGVILEAGSTCD
jgi:hypothetical protein